MIYTLIYLSAAYKLMEDDELDEILAISRQNNRYRHITGILLYGNGSFIQVLEGPKESVLRLFDKICQDYRHTGHLKLLSFESEQRSFTDWSMGFKRHDHEMSTLQGFNKVFYNDILMPLDAEHHYDKKIQTLLESFIETNKLST